MQNNADNRQIIILSVLLLFVVMWLYTEITEYRNRSAFVEEVNDFMYKGDRFTQPEGDELESRVEKLERKEQ